LIAKPSPGVHILNGHILVREKGDPEIFRQLLQKLCKTVKLIPVGEAVEMIQRRTVPPEPYVAFTFDDGFEEQYTGIAPVLEEFGINAAFFIIPGFVDGDQAYRDNLYRTTFTRDRFLTSPKPPMTWEQIADLQKRGHIIGSHGMNHSGLLSAGTGILKEEIIKSKEVIESKTGAPCEYFAYPFGTKKGIGKEALKMAKENYLYVFSQSEYRKYFSFDGAVINRRHFEPFWSVRHVVYFLSANKKF